MNEKKLQKAGYKLTQPRIAVLRALERSDHPMSAGEIHKKTRRIDLASAYRTLKLLTELGIASEETIDGETHYYLGARHHHITCTSCGKTDCIPCDHKLPSIQNFTNITHQLMLSGICGGCA
ncbi:MAG: Fur family transcriptional regulator [Patescibacteria group bacterium]|nr:Fur family transcriptional regulator [bacterium]MDZ4221628.1 Fur family transcriptional regulator [Patescibacteria group bacterium]